MWRLQRWALARLSLFEAVDDSASNCVNYEKHQGKDNADGRSGDNAYGRRVALGDQYVCKYRVEDGAPKAAGERLHHIESERGRR